MFISIIEVNISKELGCHITSKIFEPSKIDVLYYPNSNIGDFHAFTDQSSHLGYGRGDPSHR